MQPSESMSLEIKELVKRLKNRTRLMPGGPDEWREEPDPDCQEAELAQQEAA